MSLSVYLDFLKSSINPELVYDCLGLIVITHQLILLKTF